MFTLVLRLHSMIRWAALILGGVAVYRSWRAQAGHRPWGKSDAAIVGSFVAALDLQLLLGAALWLRSPISLLGFHELDLGFADPVLRFWTFVHPLLMLAVIVLAHVGAYRIRRLQESAARHRTAVMCIGLALVLLLAGIPWPFLSYGRPLVWPIR
jgi:hypothetical protein